MMFDFVYNGSSARDHGAAVARRPGMPAPARRSQAYDIAGRDGSLVEPDGTYGDVEIEVQMNFLAPPDGWMGRWQEIMRWLYGDGDGRLAFSDCPDSFRKVKGVSVGAAERAARTVGRFTATFTCDPYAYLNSGMAEMPMEGALLNPYCLCHPTYRIGGNGRCALAVNGKEMSAEVGQNLTIDTDRMLAYREDGTLMNTSVAGDYDGLYLLPGMNSISVSDGFSLSVMPNWRTL